MTNKALENLEKSISTLISELDDIPNEEFYDFFVEKGMEFESLDNFQFSFPLGEQPTFQGDGTSIYSGQTTDTWNKLNQCIISGRAA